MKHTNQLKQINQLMTYTNNTTWVNEHIKRVNESVMKQWIKMRKYTASMGSEKKMKCQCSRQISKHINNEW